MKTHIIFKAPQSFHPLLEPGAWFLVSDTDRKYYSSGLNVKENEGVAFEQPDLEWVLIVTLANAKLNGLNMFRWTMTFSSSVSLNLSHLPLHHRFSLGFRPDILLFSRVQFHQSPSSRYWICWPHSSEQDVDNSIQILDPPETLTRAKVQFWWISELILKDI